MKIEIRNLCKSFGENKALDNLSFTIEDGQAFGILGRNGAGKTTFIRILLGIMDADSGEILINGKDIRKENVKFGYLPEERGLYLKYKVCDQLLYFAELNGIKKSDAKNLIKEQLKLFKIEDYYNKKIEELSKGNKQKVQLIAAILHNPDIVVLDEPFSGLDPVNVELFKNIINKLLEEKKTIIFSSHQMNSVEEFCNNVILLKKGNIKLKGCIDDIKKEFSHNKIKLCVNKDIDEFIHMLPLEISEKKDLDYFINYKNKEDVNKLIYLITQKNISIKNLTYIVPTLNEIFIDELGD